MSADDPLLRAVLRAVDPVALRREIEAVLPRPSEASPAPQLAPPIAVEVMRRVMLVDLLDDSILNAHAGDKSFPLRAFLAELQGALPDETAFALACGLNFFFRAELMDEEWRMRTAIEVSRLYYRFVAGRFDPATTRKISPLFAAMLSSELARVRLEAVDHAAVFDSAVHERDAFAKANNAAIKRPTTLLCRVTATGVVRIKAEVLT